ncbi:MAG TPA: response regulator transcription factor [Bryocella sp.]|nr:response regulator transcription factor [Bryocella sp.]
MPSRPHILVVDDETQITRALRTTLNAQGYDIRVANDGETALEIVKDFTPDLVITDLIMPNMDGIELCRQLRRTSQVPILVLSVRGEERSKIQALDSGADDYITKPFSTGELLARVRALLRRVPGASPEQKTKIDAGDFRIDIDAHLVRVGERDVRLTPKEFDVLLYMAQHPHKVLTHRAILNAVWGSNSVEQNEYLRVFVGQLRKKLEPSAGSPKYILTEPWVGYRFEPGD